MGLPCCKVMGLKVYVHAFGCRSSLCEGEYIAGALKSYGAEIVKEYDSDTDAAIVVTCSVTNEADRKCRRLVRSLRGKIPGGVIAVCGCWSQGLDVNAAREMGIDILAGTKGKNILPRAVMDMLNTTRNFQDLRTQDIFSPSEWEELSLTQPVMHSRAFIKIQDGCNHFCTYCIIPFMRGRPVSRPIKNIIDEVQRLIDGGTKEIIFTGIHLGIYGRDIDTSLSALIRETAKISGLHRLRMGSLEPFCLDDELLAALSECGAFCHHLHLPLQSGDDDILADMRRGYRASDFVKVCEKARAFLGDDLHISSDIIAGFPGESDTAFMNTLDVMRASGLGRVHVFPYSERKNTIAATLPGKIPHDVKISRVEQAITLGRELLENYAERFVGHDVEILIEHDSKGHTRHYIDAECVGENNEIVTARALRYDNGKFECVRGN